MAVNSHKLIVIYIMLNMMIHLASAIYFSPSTVDTEYLSNEDVIMKEFASDFKSEEALPGSNTNLAFETTYGNPISIGS